MYNQIYSQIAYVSINPNFSSDQLGVQALSTDSEALPQLKGLFVGKSEPSFWHYISPGWTAYSLSQTGFYFRQ